MEKKPIQLRSLNVFGYNEYVKQPGMGSLQPDNFGVHSVGYTSNSIPTFSEKFIEQFMKRAVELETRDYFV